MEKGARPLLGIFVSFCCASNCIMFLYIVKNACNSKTQNSQTVEQILCLLALGVHLRPRGYACPPLVSKAIRGICQWVRKFWKSPCGDMGEDPVTSPQNVDTLTSV